MENQNSNQPTPRIPASLISNFVGRNVIVAGKILAVNSAERNGLAKMEGGDGSPFYVNLSSCQANYDAQICEVLGQIANDLTIQAFRFVEFQPNFDLAQYETAVFLSRQHSDVFGSQ
eukprot:GCRY01000586.1.p1 GENE.GCRY01000586.1~~GCRY01000586.1.p1  ORF type:complete len:117 (-),score=15.59 GCRY01000586.1:201-551(-)